MLSKASKIRLFLEKTPKIIKSCNLSYPTHYDAKSLTCVLWANTLWRIQSPVPHRTGKQATLTWKQNLFPFIECCSTAVDSKVKSSVKYYWYGRWCCGIKKVWSKGKCIRCHAASERFQTVHSHLIWSSIAALTYIYIYQSQRVSVLNDRSETSLQYRNVNSTHMDNIEIPLTHVRYAQRFSQMITYIFEGTLSIPS